MYQEHTAKRRAELIADGLCRNGALHGQATRDGLCKLCLGKKQRARLKSRGNDAVKISIALDEVDNNGPACDCGRPKDSKSEACDRCLYLDGRAPQRGQKESKARQVDIIDILRGTDGMTLREICVGLGMNEDYKNGQRHIWRHIKRLLEDRRVRRYWREDDTGPLMLSAFGREQKVERNAARCGWAYILDGATAEEWERRKVAA